MTDRSLNTPGARRTSLGAETEELLNQRRNSDRALRLSDLDGAVAEVMLRISRQKGFVTEIPEIPDDSIVFAKLAAAAVRLASEGFVTPADNELSTAAWAKAYADSVGRVLLATRTASASATLDFTEFNNAVYRRYEFELENVLPATDSAGMRLLTSTNNGASYDSGAADYSHTRVIKVSGAVTTIDSAGAAQISVATNIGNAAGEKGVSGVISLWNAGLAVRTTVQMALHYFDAAAGHIAYTDGSGARLANQDTDAVRFLMTSGNITSGTIRMFGIV